MRYLFLLWGDESAELALSPEERQAIVAAHGAFLTGLQAEGRSVSGEPLGPSAGAVVVRPGGSGRSISDGPFLETKEQLGGFYLIDARDRHDAIELARRIPQSPGLTIEIRPIPD